MERSHLRVRGPKRGARTCVGGWSVKALDSGEVLGVFYRDTQRRADVTEKHSLPLDCDNEQPETNQRLRC